MKFLLAGDYCCNSIPEISKDLMDLFQTFDFFCINFEAPIAGNLPPVIKAGPTIKQINTLDLCKQIGVTHYSLANNHIMDYGEEGLENTIELIEKCGTVVGASFERSYNAYGAQYIKHNGLTVALLAFAEAQYGCILDPSITYAGYAWFNHPLARKSIMEAKKNADFVIVQNHAGLEMYKHPLPELRDIYKEQIDLGASLVVGHHPHIIQGKEIYQDKEIYYSLGNFYMDQMFGDESSASGALLAVTLTNNKIKTDLIPLTHFKQVVDIDRSNDTIISINELSDFLNDAPKYYNEVNTVCNFLWRNVYQEYYSLALNAIGIKPRFKSSFKFLRCVLRMLVKGNSDISHLNALLLHNIQIETHRWVVQRALKL